MTTKKLMLVLGTLLLAAVILSACGAKPTEAPVVATPEPLPVVDQDAVPYYIAWAGSGHNAVDSEPFRHWDEDDPAEVPASCARCHVPGETPASSLVPIDVLRAMYPAS